MSFITPFMVSRSQDDRILGYQWFMSFITPFMVSRSQDDRINYFRRWFSHENYGDQRALVVKVLHTSLLDWTLCLQLLSDELVNEVIFKSQDSTLKLNSSAQRTIVITTSSQRDFDCNISKRNLLYVVGFFSRYYRDGYAEVDHTDFDNRI